MATIRKESDVRSGTFRRPLVAALVFAGVASAFVSTASIARADGVLPAEASPVQREQAQSRFLRGKDLMAKQSYDLALAEFRASHDIVASPNTRLEVARCLLAMGRLVDAYAELGRTSVEAKELEAEDNRYERAYQAATAERNELQPKLGFVTLTIDNPTDATRVVVGGEEIRRAAWTEPAPVVAGTTEIVVSTPGHADVTRSVTLAAGASTALTVDAQSGAPDAQAPAVTTQPPSIPPPHPNHLRTYAYVAGGVGAAGLLTFAILGAMAHSDYSDLQSACGGGPCPASKSDEISSGKTKQTVANVGLAVGIAGAAVGATLFVISLKQGSANDRPAPSAAIVVGPGWLGMRGTL
jgi:hypothetical protein